ncbi:MAG: phosphatidate cytidylyltransferase [Oscillospiraceae bacterium]|nr:phosphatidate cytidylyltransferase [Oscillospiraceae bacterium]
MKTRIIAAVIFVPLIFIVLVFLPAYVLTGVVAIICAVSAYELLHAIGGKLNDRVRIYAVLSSIIIPIGAYFEMVGMVFPAVLLVLMSLTFVEAIVGFQTVRRVTFAQVMTAIFAGALIPLMLSSLISLKLMPNGHLLVLLPIISAFITDAGGYFTGMFIGKKNAFPLVSPKKTVEGCVGGLAAGTFSIIVFGVVVLFTTMNIVVFWALLLYGILGSVLSQLGDLAFSVIKREFDIKDYGRLIPGHGGMLDRFDSMIFAAPAMYLLVLLIPAIIVR